MPITQERFIGVIDDAQHAINNLNGLIEAIQRACTSEDLAELKRELGTAVMLYYPPPRITARIAAEERHFRDHSQANARNATRLRALRQGGSATQMAVEAARSEIAAHAAKRKERGNAREGGLTNKGLPTKARQHRATAEVWEPDDGASASALTTGLAGPIPSDTSTGTITELPPAPPDEPSQEELDALILADNMVIPQVEREWNEQEHGKAK